MCLANSTALHRYARSLTRHDVEAEDPVHNALVRGLLSILHNVYVDSSRARHAEARRLARAGAVAEPHLPTGQDRHVRLRPVRQAFLGLPKSSVRLCLSSRLSASPMPRRLPCPAFRSAP